MLRHLGGSAFAGTVDCGGSQKTFGDFLTVGVLREGKHGRKHGGNLIW